MTSPQVFLSYAREDLNQVKRLHQAMRDGGLQVWFDMESMKPGQWKTQIERAIARCSHFVICLSESAIRKTGEAPGFQDSELQQAYEIARAQDSRNFTIVPVRLEDCSRGDHRLSTHHQFDLFDDWERETRRLISLLGGCSSKETTSSQSEPMAEKALSDALFGKAITFLYAGDFAKLLAIAESLAVLTSRTMDAERCKAIALSGLNRHSEASGIFKNLCDQDDKDSMLLCSTALSLAQERQYEEALHFAQRATRADELNPSAWRLVSTLLRSLYRHDEALNAINTAERLDPLDLVTLGAKGTMLLNLRRGPEALEHALKALETYPNDSVLRDVEELAQIIVKRQSASEA